MHFLSDSTRDFLVRRAAEACGLVILAVVGAFSVALATWSIGDPSWNHASDGAVHNLLGSPGAISADMIMQLFGVSIVTILTPFACWGWTLLTRRRLHLLRTRIILLAVGAAAAAALASLLPTTDRWPLPSGLGGVVGDGLLALPRHFVGTSEVGRMILGMICAGIAILTLTASAGFGLREDVEDDDEAAYKWVPAARHPSSGHADEAGEPGLAIAMLDGLLRAGTAGRDAILRGLRSRRDTAEAGGTRFAPWVGRGGAPDAPFADLEDEAGEVMHDGERREPTFGGLDDAPAPRRADTPSRPTSGRPADDAPAQQAPASKRVSMPAPSPRPAAADWDRGPAWDAATFQLPSPLVLAEPRRQHTGVSEDALEQNARLLEGVLEDFGVRGEIINVRPGPVVTLYELEPAPGTKSSRVIGLADDIARSMSAVSARVAVVPGRNAIGVELPNQPSRETVYLRELLDSGRLRRRPKQKLAHLRLERRSAASPSSPTLRKHAPPAGGRHHGLGQVGRHQHHDPVAALRPRSPKQCRLIMVDPKMLELSVYDGIPHLLSPVVTDPKKAVIALKWAVREMEERYKKMSKLSCAQHRRLQRPHDRSGRSAKGETITRTVQSGFDKADRRDPSTRTRGPWMLVAAALHRHHRGRDGRPDDGGRQGHRGRDPASRPDGARRRHPPHHGDAAPLRRRHHGHHQGELPDPHLLPGHVQDRLAHHPRRAWAPSSCSAKATCSTWRAADALARVHGPFVSDGEVEKVVLHLKAQGRPDYLDVITVDPDSDEEPVSEDGAVFDKGAFGDEGGDLYDQAVRVVLRDKKCSTSYIQRRLQIGYNKAASLVERMEREGLVGAANHAGKREILVEPDRRAGFEDEDDR